MITIEKIQQNPSTDGGQVTIYMVDNIDNWNEFTEWLYNLEEKEMSLMVSGNVYRFRSMEERRFFVLGFSKAWDVIDEIPWRCIMALSLCCQWLEPRTKRDGTVVYENIINEQSLQLGAYKNGKYSRERIIDTYRNNVEEHLRIVPKLVETGIKSFRISSSLFPLFEFCGELARNDQQLLQRLSDLGDAFKEAGCRVTTHPGQFTVLSSDKQQVVDNSIKELEYHAWIFDQMGFDQSPYYAINIHGGKANRSQQLIDVIKSLPDNVRNRLTLENDEKCYNVKQLCEIHSSTNIPIVFDSHHYCFNTADVSMSDSFSICIDTWGNHIPLQHISNSEPGTENGSFNEKRSHSKMIHYVPQVQLDAIRDNSIDLDVEAKNKNLAIFQMRKDFNVEV